MSSGSDLDYVRARERVADCLIDLGDYQVKNHLHKRNKVESKMTMAILIFILRMHYIH